MNSDRNWHTFGWVDVDEFLARAIHNGWQIRYEDGDRLIVRIPPRVGQSESWNVLETVPGCTTRDRWLQIPRSKRVLREVLAEQFGLEVARAIVDGISIGDD